MNKEKIAFVLEGESREVQIANNIEKIFFGSKNNNIEVINLSAGMNIYMLWEIMQADDFDTDIIEVIREKDEAARKRLDGIDREQFSEVYLFFDYDGHQNNIKSDNNTDVVMEMLSDFDNETDQGKLYISYPMIEALRDRVGDDCDINPDCIISFDAGTQYKNSSSGNKKESEFTRYDISEWRNAITSFALRLGCLLDQDKSPYFKDYQKINPMDIYNKQLKKYICDGKIFILSAIPEFLLDYNREPFYYSMITRQTNKRNSCKKWEA